jgi:monothiol glutaredoxin
MKGSPGSPQCGFSAEIVRVLASAGLNAQAMALQRAKDGRPVFGSFNVFDDEDVRQGLKEYSKWPTYPQLYVEGNFQGGLDVIKEMHEAGELEPLLKVE